MKSLTIIPIILLILLIPIIFFRLYCPFSVDAVYTWVDTTDTEWVGKRDNYKKSIENIENIENIDVSEDRDITTKGPYDEISLSLDMLKKNIPWINNIYVVTMRPQKLPEEILKKHNIKIVYHDEIFDNVKNLPTFNSCPIEANIHNINGLSEHFIYFNDDMYINKPMSKYHFFGFNNPVVRFDHSYKIEKDREKSHNLWNLQHKMGVELLSSYKVLVHQASPVTKTILRESKEKFKNEYEYAETLKLRSESIIPVYLAMNYAYSLGKCQINDTIIRQRYIKSQNLKPSENLSNIHLICVNKTDPESFELFKSIVI